MTPTPLQSAARSFSAQIKAWLPYWSEGPTKYMSPGEAAACALLPSLDAAIAASESEPEVERIEIWPGIPVSCGSFKDGRPYCLLRKEDGWHVYAERPKPKPAPTPSIEERLEKWAAHDSKPGETFGDWMNDCREAAAEIRRLKERT